MRVGDDVYAVTVRRPPGVAPEKMARRIRDAVGLRCSVKVVAATSEEVGHPAGIRRFPLSSRSRRVGGSMLKCPVCGAKKTVVTDTRKDDHNGVRRVRGCHRCDARFNTVEYPSDETWERKARVQLIAQGGND